MRLLIFGLGYSARHIAALLPAARIAAMCRAL